LELKKQSQDDLTIINLAQLKDDSFNSIHRDSEGMRMGALVTANRIAQDGEIQENYPVLHQSALKHGSRQVRQTATIGGNLCTASPAGDMACALVALQARCEILSAEGDIRIVPTEGFFLGVRKIDLEKNEILRSIFIPKKLKGSNIHSDFIKLGTRSSMECAIVSLAYHFVSGLKGDILHCGIAIGSSAPTIKFCKSACQFLTGKIYNKISIKEAEEFANLIVGYASPISDIRASAWYRKEALYNVAKGIFV
jgi:CO/xanthine dehydrogenase FAD-binding subunit